MGEDFGPLIHIYPHSVQADLIRMKLEPIHYVWSDGAQADTPPLQWYVRIIYLGIHQSIFSRYVKTQICRLKFSSTETSNKQNSLEEFIHDILRV